MTLLSTDSFADDWAKNLGVNEKNFKTFFERMIDGFAYHKIVVDEVGKPVDYVFLEINNVFERMTGLKRDEVLGKKVTDVLKGIEKDPADWIGRYGKVALTCKPIQFENYAEPLGKWFNVTAYCPHKGYFVAIFEDITKRKKAEATVNQQAFMLENANDAIIGYDLNFKVTFWNKSAEKLYGFKAAEALGKVSTDLFNPQYVGVSRDELIDKLLTEDHLETESIRTTKDGSCVNIEAHVILLRDSSSKPLGYVSVDRDITERKKNEQALLRSEKLLQQSQEIAHLGSWELDLTENKLTWSDEVYRIFGLKPQEFGATYEAFLAAIHPDDRSLVDTAYSSSVSEERDGYEIKHRVIRKDNGEVRFVQEKCSHFRDKSGKIIRSVGMVNDITERQKAEEELRKAKEDWERTFDAVPDFVSIMDTNYHIVRANQSMAKQLGVTPEEASGSICYECIHGTSSPPNNCPHAQLIKDGKQHTAELHEPRLGGDFIVSATPLHDEHGKLIGSVHVARNITQRKKAEEELRTLNETLEERVRERTQEAINERQRLYNVLETLPPYIILLDKNYHVAFANKVFRELFGESKGRPCYEFLFKRDSPCENCETYKVLKNNKPYRWEWRGPNGRDYDIYDFPFKDEDGSTLILEMGLDITERRLAEAEVKKYQTHLEQLVAERTEALILSEQRWATTLSSIGDAVIATDIQGKVSFMNPVAETLTGWTLGEAKGKSIKKVFKIINQKTRRPVVSPVSKILSSGLVVGLANHTILVRKDETEIPIDDSGAPIIGGDGKVSGVVLVFRDITQRRKTEEALRRQASLIDLSPDAIIVRKMDGTITFWSQGAEKLYGWKKEEALGKTTHDLFGTKYPEDFSAIIGELQEKNRWKGELVHRTKRGKEVFVQSSWLAEQAENDKITSILESNVDLTERKKAEKQIEWLATFPTLNPNPVLEVDIKGRINYANPATYKLFPDLKTQGVKHIFLSNWANIVKIFKDNKNINSFNREIKMNDHWYQQQFYLVPQTLQIRIYTTDIDELKKVEEARANFQLELREYADQMEKLAEQRAQQLQNAERLAAIGQTAGMVGHDIRNPLQAITSDIYIISEEAKTIRDEESKEAVMESLESINQNLTYINKIVSDLQDFTKPLRPNLQETDFAELVKGILTSIIIPKGIEVKTEVEKTAKRAIVDVAFMRRILTNLLTNAVQAMQEHGELSLYAAKEDGSLKIVIEDTGEGIPEEVKSKLFTPLFTTKSKGQGLGLAVVKRLVESLKGTISFDSEAGKGTKFMVVLPQTTKP